MNYTIVKYILGQVLNIEGAFMVFPLITALIYREPEGGPLASPPSLSPHRLPSFQKKGGRSRDLFKRSLRYRGYLLDSFKCHGECSFCYYRNHPQPIDALFETVSGFTTTGSSILTDVESLPRCMIFWRSFTHWLGGMGVLVLLLPFCQSKAVRI